MRTKAVRIDWNSQTNPMLTTSTRLLSLLSLLQVRREWTGSELAERLDVDPRTIRRDIDRLRSIGYPIQAAPGVAGGYRLSAGGVLPPLLLDDAEAVAVAVGLRTVAAGTIAGIEETSVRALTKLEQVLPNRLRRQIRALSDATSSFAVDGPQIDAEALTTIASACRDAVRLRFPYLSADDRSTHRHVQPVAVVHSGWRWYLVAFDLDREDWRTFRIDRIGGTVRPAERGRRLEVPGGDAAAFVQMRLRGTSPVADGDQGRHPLAGRVRVHAPAAEIAARVPTRHAIVEPDGDAHCIVSTRAPWSRQFLLWAAQLSEPIELLGPPELVDAAARLADAVTQSQP